MEEKNNKNKIILSIALVLLLVIATVGITYAFFNYTRTGPANTLNTGRIYFSTEQTNQNTITLNNIFPMTKEQALADTSTNGTLVVTFNGDTEYTDGMEYLLSIDSVTGTANVPISLIMDVNITENNVAVAENSNYYTAREAKNASMYKAEGVDTTINSTTHKVITDIETGKYLLAGYIKSGEYGINGSITIKAFIDADNILITDTPNDQSNAPTGVSFKVKGEANPGIWVPEPSQGTMDSCPGCKFIYSTTEMYTTWNTISETPTQITSGLFDNYEELISTTGKNYFFEVKLNNNNEVTNAYACGIKDGTPFCIEGASDGSKYTANQGLINGASLWNNTCNIQTQGSVEGTICGPWDNASLSASADSYGDVDAGVGRGDHCDVYSNGGFRCIESSGEGGQ